MYLVNFLGNLDNLGYATLEACGECGLRVGLFLKDERREEGNDFLGLVLSEDVLQDKFRQDEFVSRMDLEYGRQ